MIISYSIIATTSLISLLALNNERLKERLMFIPYLVEKDKQYERFISCGFVHSSIWHLALNMWVLYMFGPDVEMYFTEWFNGFGGLMYVVFYFLAIIFSCIPAWLRHKNNLGYRALGASGGTSAIFFALILVEPLQEVALVIFPIFSFYVVVGGLIFLLYEFYADFYIKDNIGHAAHYAGAIFGFTFPLIFNYKIIFHFFDQVKTLFI